MKHTHPLRLAAMAFVLAGSVLSFQAEWTMLTGQLSGQGSSLTSLGVMDDTALHMAGPAVAETMRSAEIGIQLIFGVLLVLLGFFLHALLATREEHAVPIRIVEKPKRRRAFYWMEMHVER